MNADGTLCTVQVYNLALFDSALQDREMGNWMASVMKNYGTLNAGDRMPHCGEKGHLYAVVLFVVFTNMTS